MKEINTLFIRLTEDINELLDEVLNRRFDFHSALYDSVEKAKYESYLKKKRGSESTAIYMYSLYERFLLKASKTIIKSKTSASKKYTNFIIKQLYDENDKNKNAIGVFKKIQRSLLTATPAETKKIILECIDDIARERCFGGSISGMLINFLNCEDKKIKDEIFKFEKNFYLEELRERRNLLVHRGSDIDSLYKKTLNQKFSKGKDYIRLAKRFTGNKGVELDAIYFVDVVCAMTETCFIISRSIANLQKKDIEEPDLSSAVNQYIFISSNISLFLEKSLKKKYIYEIDSAFYQFFLIKAKRVASLAKTNKSDINGVNYYLITMLMLDSMKLNPKYQKEEHKKKMAEHSKRLLKVIDLTTNDWNEWLEAWAFNKPKKFFEITSNLMKSDAHFKYEYMIDGNEIMWGILKKFEKNKAFSEWKKYYEKST